MTITRGIAIGAVCLATGSSWILAWFIYDQTATLKFLRSDCETMSAAVDENTEKRLRALELEFVTQLQKDYKQQFSSLKKEASTQLAEIAAKSNTSLENLDKEVAALRLSLEEFDRRVQALPAPPSGSRPPRRTTPSPNGPP